MQTIEVIPVEDKINSELVKENITEKVLANLREKYLPLTINGQDDKEGYLAVSEARKDCKRIRVLAKKICEAGREDAVTIQKAWISKQKEVVDEITKVEDYLEKQEKEYDAEKDRIAAEKKRKHDDQFVERSVELSKYGASLIEGYFVLNDISFEASSIREVDAEIWEQNIKPKYKAIFDEAQKVRVENEQKLARMEQMRGTILNSRLPQLLKITKSVSGNVLYHGEIHFAKTDEIIDMDEATFELVKSKHNKEVEDKIAADKKKKEAELRIKNRKQELYDMGFAFNGTAFVCETISVGTSTIETLDDTEWNEGMDKMATTLSKIASDKKINQLAEQKAKQDEADKIAIGTARMQTLSDYEETGYESKDLSEMGEQGWVRVLETARGKFNDAKQTELKEKEAKEKAEAEQKQSEELAKATDKERWQHFIAQVSKLELPTVKSRQYKEMLAITKEKLEEITALKP